MLCRWHSRLEGWWWCKGFLSLSCGRRMWNRKGTGTAEHPSCCCSNHTKFHGTNLQPSCYPWSINDECCGDEVSRARVYELALVDRECFVGGLWSSEVSRHSSLVIDCLATSLKKYKSNRPFPRWIDDYCNPHKRALSVRNKKQSGFEKHRSQRARMVELTCTWKLLPTTKIFFWIFILTFSFSPSSAESIIFWTESLIVKFLTYLHPSWFVWSWSERKS